MKLTKVLVSIGGFSITAIAFWSALAPAADSSAAHGNRTQLALASTPFVLRDGRQAVANVVQVGFEPQSVSLTGGSRDPLRELLSRLADGCLLSAQIVGAASEYETAPRPAVDAHLLALERADAIATIVRDSGIPGTAVASVWTVDSGRRVPDSVLWLFSSNSRTACDEPMPPVEHAAVPAASANSPRPADALIVAPPMPRPHQDRRAQEGQEPIELPAPESRPVAELALTFADNSSFLDDSEFARLRRFASNLPSTCKVVLQATVAGGAEAHYAAWLAERRIARITQYLGQMVTIENHTFLQNDGSRKVMVTISDEPTCASTSKLASSSK
jgi:hypothetical protein